MGVELIEKNAQNGTSEKAISYQETAISKRCAVSATKDSLRRFFMEHKCVFLLLVLFAGNGCSIHKLAVNSIANSIAGSSDVYDKENDPELVRRALPFALKTMESLLVDVPRHQGLLVTTSSSFTEYAYAFVWLDSEDADKNDPARAKALREEARNLYVRARDYGLRALEIEEPHFRELIEKNPELALKKMKSKDVPALYWTGISWIAAVSQAKGNMDMVADLPVIDSIMKKALELDETFAAGAIHEFYISYEASRSGGSLEKAREHFERAMQINAGTKISPLVSLAENVSVPAQNRKEFEELLDRALNFDVNKAEKQRLANLIAQRRAVQLKSEIEDFFLDEEAQAGETK